MKRRPIIRVFSGISALLLTMSLYSCDNSKIENANDIPNTPSIASSDPEEFTSEFIEAIIEDEVESAPIAEDEKYEAYKIHHVTFTDPTTGLKRRLLVTTAEQQTSLDLPNEGKKDFIKQIFGDTELAPYIDQSTTGWSIASYKSLTDPSVKVEVQSVGCVDRNSRAEEYANRGGYSKMTIYTNGYAIEDYLFYVVVDGETKRYEKTTTLYDEYGTPSEYVSDIPIVFRSIILDIGINFDDTFTKEELIAIETDMNKNINNTIKH